MRDEDFWHDFEAGRGGDGGEGIGAYQRMRLRLLQQVLLLRASGMVEEDTDDDEYEEYEEEEEEGVRLMQLQRGEGRGCAPSWH